MKKFEFYKAHITGYDQVAIPIFILQGVSVKDYRVARDVRSYALNLFAANKCAQIFSSNANKNYINKDQVTQRFKDYNKKYKLIDLSFCKCVIDEAEDLFLNKLERETLFKLKESRGDVSVKIKYLLSRLSLQEKEEFFKKVENISSSIVKIEENLIKIFLPLGCLFRLLS